MYDLSRPFSFHIELTDKCNARCVQCSRNFVDDLGNLNERPNLCLTEITIDQYKDIFKDYLHKTKTINFCGNMGDPLFAKDILAITEYSFSHVLRPEKGLLKIYTNGGFRSKKWWSEYGNFLKDKKHELNFAIDGLEDTHHFYRTNTRFHRVIENATAFIEAGGTAEWSFIRFGHNQHQEDDCRKLAKELGFKKFTAVNTQRFYGREKISYKWRDVDYSITRYKPEQKIVKALPSKDLNRTTKVWNKTPVNKISKDVVNISTETARAKFQKDVVKSTKESTGSIDCHVAMRNEVFIDCMGYVHPCCWIGSHEYHRINKIKKRVAGDDFNDFLLESREFEPAWEKSFLDTIKNDWYQHILPLSWDISPCTICARQCGKGKFTTVRQYENL